MKAGVITLIVGVLAALGGAVVPAHADVSCPVAVPPLVQQHPAADQAHTYVLGDLNGDGGADVAIEVTHYPAYCGVALEPSSTRVDIRSGKTGMLLWSVSAGTNADVEGVDLGGGRHGVLVHDTFDRVFDGTGHQWSRHPSLGYPAAVLSGTPGQADLIVSRLNTLTPRLRAVSAATGQQVWGQPDPGGVLSAVPDIDGDGRQDLLLRATTNDGHETDTVTRGASGSIWWVRQLTSVCPNVDYGTPDSGFQISYYLSGDASVVGDLNGDGYREVAVNGGPCPPVSFGTAAPMLTEILDGRNGHERWTRRGTSFPAGDANGDGNPDVLVSAFAGDQFDISHEEVTHTLVDAFGVVLATRVDTVDTGGPTGYSFTSRLRTAGDANGDGAPDLLEHLTIAAGTNPTVDRVISGRDLTLIGPDPNPAAATDTHPLLGSTDGVGDDFVTFGIFPTPDLLRVIDAVTGTPRWSYDLGNGSPFDYRGLGVLTADVNGDGRADLVLQDFRETETGGPFFATANVTDVVDGATGQPLWKFVAVYQY